MLKCNIDATTLHLINKVGFGCIIRNANGDMIGAKNGTLSAPLDPLLAEALSCREALSWIKDLGLRDVCVESDALLLITALRGTSDDFSYFGLIVQDCKRLASDLLNCSFRFVRRSANQATHVLARAADSMSGQECWEDVPPSFISNVLEVDLI